MVSTPVIHVITLITTRLATPKGWKDDPLKWSHVNYRLGKVRQSKTDFLTTEPRRQLLRICFAFAGNTERWRRTWYRFCLSPTRALDRPPRRCLQSQRSDRTPTCTSGAWIAASLLLPTVAAPSRPSPPEMTSLHRNRKLRSRATRGVRFFSFLSPFCCFLAICLTVLFLRRKTLTRTRLKVISFVGWLRPRLLGKLCSRRKTVARKVLALRKRGLIVIAVAPERIWKWEGGTGPAQSAAGKKFLGLAPPLILALKVQLVVLVSAFMMVSTTVWSVSCLLFFYSRCPRA